MLDNINITQVNITTVHLQASNKAEGERETNNEFSAKEDCQQAKVSVHVHTFSMKGNNIIVIKLQITLFSSVINMNQMKFSIRTLEVAEQSL